MAKFRSAPRRFFEDAKLPLVRTFGGRLGEWTERQPALLALLESPSDSFARLARHPWGWPVEQRLSARAARRRSRLDAHGRPLVSIIIPAHNAGDTIVRALESLLAQTYENLEIIVVDDRSSDRTREIVSTMARQSPRIRLLDNTGAGGAAPTRNVGLENASGDYLTFLDADDTSHPERIELQLHALLEDPSLVLCTCNAVRVDASGTVIRINGTRFRRAFISMMFPRRVLAELGPMKMLETGEDSEYVQRVLAHFGPERGRNIERTMYFARFSPHSLMFSRGETRVIDAQNVEYTPATST